MKQRAFFVPLPLVSDKFRLCALVREHRRTVQRIAELRRERGMTQDMLAELTGIRRPHISRIEMGKYSVGLDTLEAIAKALGCTVDMVVCR